MKFFCIHLLRNHYAFLGSIAIYFGKADGKRTEPYPAISAFYCVSFYCVEMSILGGELNGRNLNIYTLKKYQV